jgi:predicted RNase H-like HicB family nuclease
MNDLRFTVICEREENGQYYARCPGLKGVHVDGETRDEAIKNAVEAIRVYLRSVADRGDIKLEIRECP